jgi:uncharacterized protein YceH (UPF0502 family)
MDLMLSAAAARVLGSLIEKEATTPDYYPLSLNALVNACNQKSNREPVMQLTEDDVLAAIDELKLKKLVWQRSVAGARVFKYEHNIKSVFPLSDKELGVLCVLLLRGAQTVGEVRQRSERLCTFSSLEEAERVLSGLCSRGDTTLVRELPRQPGRKESRFVHLLCGEAWASEQATTEDSPAAATTVVVSPLHDRVLTLEATVASLRDELAELRKDFAELKQLLE